MQSEVGTFKYMVLEDVGCNCPRDPREFCRFKYIYIYTHTCLYMYVIHMYMYICNINSDGYHRKYIHMPYSNLCLNRLTSFALILSENDKLVFFVFFLNSAIHILVKI